MPYRCCGRSDGFCEIARYKLDRYMKCTDILRTRKDCSERNSPGSPGYCVKNAYGSTSAEEYFRCCDAILIPKKSVMDGIRDCEFGEDERIHHLYCSSVQADDFRISYGGLAIPIIVIAVCSLIRYRKRRNATTRAASSGLPQPDPTRPCDFQTDLPRGFSPAGFAAPLPSNPPLGFSPAFSAQDPGALYPSPQQPYPLLAPPPYPTAVGPSMTPPLPPTSLSGVDYPRQQRDASSPSAFVAPAAVTPPGFGQAPPPGFAPPPPGFGAAAPPAYPEAPPPSYDEATNR